MGESTEIYFGADITLPAFFFRLVFRVDFGTGLALSSRVRSASNFCLSTLLPTSAFFTADNCTILDAVMLMILATE